MTLTAADIARELAPDVRRALESHYGDALAAAGTFLRRRALALVWPTLLDEVPVGLEVVSWLLLSRFGRMNLADLVALLVEHSRRAGVPLHPSYHSMGVVIMPTDLDEVLDGMHSEITGRLEAKLEVEPPPESAPGSFGAALPVGVSATFVPSIVWSLLQVAGTQGVDFVVAHRAQIVDAVEGMAEKAVDGLLARLKGLHLGPR